MDWGVDKILFLYFEYWLHMFCVHMQYFPNRKVNIFSYPFCLSWIFFLIYPFFVFSTWFAFLNILILSMFRNIAKSYSCMLQMEFSEDFSQYSASLQQHIERDGSDLTAFRYYYIAVMQEGFTILFIYGCYKGLSSIFKYPTFWGYVDQATKSVFLLLMIVVFIWNVIRFIASYRVFGLENIKRYRFWEKSRNFSIYTIFSFQVVKLYHFWGIFYFTSFLVFKTSFFLFLAIFTYLHILFQYLQFTSPPLILFLAVSSPESLKLLKKMKKATLLRIAYLLDLNQIKNVSTIDRLNHQWVFLENFRTEESEQWLQVVKSMMEFSAFIVIDARKISPALKKEMELIVENKLLDKTIFHVGAHGEHPTWLRDALSENDYNTCCEQFYDENELIVIPKILVNLKKSSLYNPIYFLSKRMLAECSKMSIFKISLNMNLLQKDNEKEAKKLANLLSQYDETNLVQLVKRFENFIPSKEAMQNSNSIIENYSAEEAIRTLLDNPTSHFVNKPAFTLLLFIKLEVQLQDMIPMIRDKKLKLKCQNILNIIKAGRTRTPIR